MKYVSEQIEIIATFSVILQTTGKFVFFFLRMILGKVGINGFSASLRKIDVRYEFGFKVILKGLSCK